MFRLTCLCAALSWLTASLSELCRRCWHTLSTWLQRWDFGFHPKQQKRTCHRFCSVLFFFCLYINDRSILDLYREDEDEEDIFIDCIEFRNASPLSWLCVLLIQCDLDLQLAAGGSHRTLLYGQAVLFLHSNSSMVSADATQKQANRFIGPVVLKKRLFISSTSAACPHLGPPLTSWLLMSVCRKIKKVSQWRISSLLLWWWLEYISVNRNTFKW